MKNNVVSRKLPRKEGDEDPDWPADPFTSFITALALINIILIQIYLLNIFIDTYQNSTSGLALKVGLNKYVLNVALELSFG